MPSQSEWTIPLRLAGVGHTFPSGDGSGAPKRALHDISLELHQKEVLGLVGASGSGKTTLGRIAAGLLSPTEGRVEIGGVDTARWSDGRWQELRRHVRMIFQSPAAALNPFLRVRDLLEEPLIIHEPGLSKAERRDRVMKVAEELGFDRLDQYPRSLSGGEKRRASLVRALVVPCRLLIADEPTSGLDAVLMLQVLDVIREYCRQWDAALLLISHHLALVESSADRILVIQEGRAKSMEDPYSKTLWAAELLDAEGSAEEPVDREVR